MNLKGSLLSLLLLFSPLLFADDLSNDINQFAFAFSKKIREEVKENTTLSPLAVFNNLSMLWIGAEGNTKTQIKNALHISTSDEKMFLNAEQRLHRALTSTTEGYALKIANGLFTNKGTTFNTSFLHAVRDGFDAKVQALDFAHPESALSTINKWVSRTTQNKIPALLKEGDLTDKTRMVLTSALYFQGEWEHPFNPKKTKSAPFHTEPQSSIDVPTMHQVGYFDFVDETNQLLAWFPFKRSGTDTPYLECVIVLPKTNPKEGFSFSYEDFLRWREKREKKLLSIALPKFCYSTRLDLEKPLKELGMVDAFTYQANFSGINNMHDLHLNSVFHEVYTSLNESGVTAAAATASTIGVTSAPTTDEVIPFFVNQPFLFMIIDHHAHTILFMGRVNVPELEGCSSE